MIPTEFRLNFTKSWRRSPHDRFLSTPRSSDDNFDNAGVRKVVAEASKAFEIYGDIAGKIITRYPECGHDFPDDVREEAYQWLEQQLK